MFKPVLKSPEEIRQLCLDANQSAKCGGLILWMHTFSPAKMWIGGLSALRKPFLHLHTQFNRDLPWAEIDMDFMNLNQAAHGDREAGFLHTRLRLNRKVVVSGVVRPSKRRTGWPSGCARRRPGMTGRAANSRGSAITCGRWP